MRVQVLTGLFGFGLGVVVTYATFSALTPKVTTFTVGHAKNTDKLGALKTNAPIPKPNITEKRPDFKKMQAREAVDQLEDIILLSQDWTEAQLQNTLKNLFSNYRVISTASNLVVITLLDRLTALAPLSAIDILENSSFLGFQYRDNVFRKWALVDVDGMLEYALSSKKAYLREASWLLYLPNVDNSIHYDRLLKRTGQDPAMIASAKLLLNKNHEETFMLLTQGPPDSNYANGLFYSWPINRIDRAVELITSIDNEDRRMEYMKTLIENRFTNRPNAALALINTYFPNNDLLRKSAIKLFIESDDENTLTQINEYTQSTGDALLLVDYIKTEAYFNLAESMALIETLDAELKQKTLTDLAIVRFRENKETTIAWTLNQIDEKLKMRYLQKFANYLPKDAKKLVDQSIDAIAKGILVRNIANRMFTTDKAAGIAYAEKYQELAFAEKLRLMESGG